MDDLVLLIFLLSILIFPLFIFLLINVLILKYTVSKKGIKVDSLFRTVDIKYENLVSVELKRYEKSVITEGFDVLATALHKNGVLITYLFEEGGQKTVFISPSNPKRFLYEVSKYFKKDADAPSKDEVKPEKELVIPEIVES
jgi:hypothetical protein